MSYDLQGYHSIISKTRAPDDDGRGGVALYIKDTFPVDTRKDLSVFIPHVIESEGKQKETSECKYRCFSEHAIDHFRKGLGFLDFSSVPV